MGKGRAMKVLTSNKQEQVLEYLTNIYEASFEEDFEKRMNKISDEVIELAIIVGGEALMLRLNDKVCARMKRSRRC